MHPLAPYANIFLGALTILANIASLFLIFAFAAPKLKVNKLTLFFKEKSLFVAFVVSLIATFGSLVYSDVIGYEPCKLCWFQRIFMYPGVLLYGIALWKKDYGIRIYGAWLSVIGAFIALFHYVGQLGWNPLGLECLAIGQSASCSKNFVMIFGYITIPMMALSAFILIALTLFYSIRREKPADDFRIL